MRMEFLDPCVDMSGDLLAHVSKLLRTYVSVQHDCSAEEGVCQNNWDDGILISLLFMNQSKYA